MQDLTDEGRRTVEEVAARHGVTADAVSTLLRALVAGGGSMAQFNHAAFGGMGQWSQGGMIMVGDMFNHGLKSRVDALCNELAGLLRSRSLFVPMPARVDGDFGLSGGFSSDWWPAALGSPSSTGSQNDMHYAFFPTTRRLAVSQAGRITIYDTKDHMISGASQQQGGSQSLTFTSQYGAVRVADLETVGADMAYAPAPSPVVDVPAVAPAPEVKAPASPSATPVLPQRVDAADDLFAKIERLAELAQKGILTADEFAAKKTELLSRL